MSEEHRDLLQRVLVAIATLATIAGVAYLLAGMAVVVATPWTLTEFWDLCRTTNKWVALGAAFGLFYRLTLMALDRERWRDRRARHLTLWFLYVTLGLVNVYFGSAHYDSISAPASWPSGLRFGLNIMAIVLTGWWPHPARLTHLEETYRGTRP